jgi:hypothetical protein
MHQIGVTSKEGTMKRIALLLTIGVALAATSAASAARSPTATDVLASLRHAGMPVGKFVAYTEVTDQNHLLGRPGQYTSKVNFHDTRIQSVAGFDTSGGGSVEVFKSRDDAKRRFVYVQNFGKTSMFAEYDYLAGAILLRLSNVLTPSQAAKYKVALLKIG